MGAPLLKTASIPEKNFFAKKSLENAGKRGFLKNRKNPEAGDIYVCCLCGGLPGGNTREGEDI